MYGFEYQVKPSAASSNFERVIVFAEDLTDAEKQLAAVTLNGERLAAWTFKEKSSLLATKN
jgi:hypothetical protein